MNKQELIDRDKAVEEAYKKGFKRGRDKAWAEVKLIMETGRQPIEDEGDPWDE